MDVIEFLLARIRDFECCSKDAPSADLEQMILHQCDAMREIIDWHKSWPVLVETAPKYEMKVDKFALDTVSYRMQQHTTFLSEQEYLKNFGSRPPTAPIISIMVRAWSSHPDFQDEWLA